jgi:sigma-B regulation protein RsbU (phosphoserine phosphatase)
MAEWNPTQSATGEPGSGSSNAYLQEQLLDRRRRLAAHGPADRPEVQALLQDVDAALARLDAGSFGLCEACHDPIEGERLIADPLVRVCLECLSPEQARALERDLELASSIQTALLPKDGVALDGWEIHYRYQPLGPVSGDHCDVLLPSTPDEPLHFVLGDVSGKGVAASILMSHLHAIFRSLVPLRLPLAELVRHANRLFAESTLPSSYATLVAGRLHRSGQLELSNLGHVPPAVARNGSVISLSGSGFPLGLFADSVFDVHRMQLEADDLVLLYTDGLSEARNATGEQYGSSRIDSRLRKRGSATAPAVLQDLLDDLGVFAGETPRDDDLTLMAIRRTR